MIFKRFLPLAALIGFVSFSWAGSSDCGTPIAEWQGHVVTDQHLAFRERTLLVNDPIAELTRLRTEDPEFAETAREMMKAEIVDALIDLEKSKDVATQQRPSDFAPLEDAWSTWLRGWLLGEGATVLDEAIRAEQEQSHATLLTGDEAMDRVVELRTILIRQDDEDGSSAHIRLTDLIEQIKTGGIDPETAARQYSEHSSAADGGVISHQRIAEIPEFARNAVAALTSEGDWTPAIELPTGAATAFQLLESHPIELPSSAELAPVVTRLLISRDRSTTEIAAFEKEGLDPEDRAAAIRTLLERDGPIPQFWPECHAAFRHAQSLGPIQGEIDGAAKWDAADEAQREEWYEEFKSYFTRMWTLERFEYRLVRERTAQTNGDDRDTIREYWIEHIVPELENYQLGMHRGGAIPDGWFLEVKPMVLQMPVRPSGTTPQPPSSPIWRAGDLFSEGEATISRDGDSDYYTMDELDPDQLRAIMANALMAKDRRELRERISHEIEWEGALAD